MKHLKKYNETRQDIEQLDFEYIKSCFIEFIDKGNIWCKKKVLWKMILLIYVNTYWECKPINIAKKGSIMGTKDL
jgi:hypothetical protein